MSLNDGENIETDYFEWHFQRVMLWILTVGGKLLSPLSARTHLCGGCRATDSPTATATLYARSNQSKYRMSG
jgi:hypothetical protein